MTKSATKLQKVPMVAAQKRLGTILDRANKNDERFVVSKKGEATAVILGYEDYIRNILRLEQPSALRSIRESAKRLGSSKLSQQSIDAEIRKARVEKRSKRAS
jgi:prevent-host-death family protein